MVHDSSINQPERIVKVEFELPVTFSTITRAFTGAGIPAIPADARRVKVSERVTAYISQTGEVWEFFNGKGASEKSEMYYWPTLEMCPRAWAQAFK